VRGLLRSWPCCCPSGRALETRHRLTPGRRLTPCRDTQARQRVLAYCANAYAAALSQGRRRPGHRGPNVADVDCPTTQSNRTLTHVADEPKTDFRERRLKLPPGSFTIEPEDEPPTSALIDRRTWVSVTGLPDDVSLRTSDHHGTVIRRAQDCWGEWISLVLDIQSLGADPTRDSLAVAAMNVADELQVSGTWP